MTRALDAGEIARRINEAHAEAAISSNETDVWVRPDDLVRVAKLLRNDPQVDLQMLNSISAVDYVECFELVYHFRSLRLNTTLVLKARCYDRESPSFPSLTGVWTGADLQEREVWDLMGVSFTDHPNLKRILLWEGFPGHPLRKDFIR